MPGYDEAPTLLATGSGGDGRSADAAADLHVADRRDQRQEPDSCRLSGSGVRTDHRETADGYAGELFRHDGYRVSICRDGMQWLYQRQRRGFPAGGAPWDTLGYCRTRAGLMRLHRVHTGGDSTDIAALPADFNVDAH